MEDIWPDSSHKAADAYYQASHAVVALHECLNVVRVSIVNEDGASSWIDVTYPLLSPSRLSRSIKARCDARSVIRALLAGPAAQSQYSFGTCPIDYPLPDFNLADRLIADSEAVWRAISLAGKISNDAPSLIRSMWRRVYRLIQGDETWPAVDAVAKALLMNGELAGCEVRDIARHATITSRK